MGRPNFKEEKIAWNRGYRKILGVDESGRGCLAGPVVAAAVSLGGPSKYFLNKFSGLKESKKISASRREEIFKLALSDPRVKWNVARVSEKVIDRINIFEATKLAMKRAVMGLEADFILIDGIIKLNLDIPQKSVVRGDDIIYSCALASVFAKVIRDKAMINYHRKYSCYGFDRHKGYSTRLHQGNIKQHGLCKIHRRSYAPCRQTLAKRRFSC